MKIKPRKLTPFYFVPCFFRESGVKCKTGITFKKVGGKMKKLKKIMKVSFILMAFSLFSEGSNKTSKEFSLEFDFSDDAFSRDLEIQYGYETPTMSKLPWEQHFFNFEDALEIIGLYTLDGFEKLGIATGDSLWQNEHPFLYAYNSHDIANYCSQFDNILDEINEIEAYSSDTIKGFILSSPSLNSAKSFRSGYTQSLEVDTAIDIIEFSFLDVCSLNQTIQDSFLVGRPIKIKNSALMSLSPWKARPSGYTLFTDKELLIDIESKATYAVRCSPEWNFNETHERMCP